MNHNIISLNCDITRDLLPLYHDQVLSDSSRQSVEAHLEVCPDCRREYQELCGALPGEHSSPGTRKKFQALARKLRWKPIFAAVLAAVLVGGLVTAAFQLPILPVEDPEVLRAIPCTDTDGRDRLFVVSRGELYGPMTQHVDVTGTEPSELHIKGRRPLVSSPIDPDHMEIHAVLLDLDSPISKLTYQGKTIWTQAENGSDPIPPYVEAALEMGRPESQIEGISLGEPDGSISVQYRNGRVVCWDLDGNVIRDDKVSR